MPPLSDIKKAIGALLTGLLAWGTAVVASDPSAITASEWIGLAGVAVTTATVYILKNEAPDA